MKSDNSAPVKVPKVISGPDPPKYKGFDLKVGDTVRCDTLLRETRVKYENPKYNRWKVILILDKTFICQNPYGIKTAFIKTDYLRGEIKRIEGGE